MTSNTWNLPNMVNYKLGALVGSGCDTVVADIRHETLDDRQIQVSPNPASSKVKITATGEQQDMLLTIYNTLGQIMGTSQVNRYVELNLSDFENGVYQLVIINSKGDKFSQHLVIAK